MLRRLPPSCLFRAALAFSGAAARPRRGSAAIHRALWLLRPGGGSARSRIVGVTHHLWFHSGGRGRGAPSTRRILRVKRHRLDCLGG